MEIFRYEGQRGSHEVAGRVLRLPIMEGERL